MSTEDHDRSHGIFLPDSRALDTSPLRRTPAETVPAARRYRNQRRHVLQNIQRAVEAVGEAAYHWIIESDEIFWSAT